MPERRAQPPTGQPSREDTPVLLYHPLATIVHLCRDLVSRETGEHSTPPPSNSAHRTATFSLVGPLSAGKSTCYSINGVDFELEPETAIYGELRFGALAHVSGTYRRHTVRVARKVIVAPPERARAPN